MRIGLVVVLAALCTGAAWASAPLAEAADLKLGEARYLLDTGKLDQALDAVNAAIHLDPLEPAYLLLLGRIQLVRGKTAEAQLAFSEAARLDPANAAAASIASSLTRKAGLRAYAEGVEAFNKREWRRASRLLKQALDQGNLPPEHSAIAQQDLIIAQFSLSRVADEIRTIQEARRDTAQDYLRRKITPADAEAYPVSAGAGNRISFAARVVDIRDGVLYVGTQQQGFTYRDFASNEGVYAVVTPAPLPHDPRVARGATVFVQGRVIEPNFGTRAAVRADFLSFRFERGLAGPLRVDFLRFNDEQRANLE